MINRDYTDLKKRLNRLSQAFLEYIVLFIAVISVIFVSFNYIANTKKNIIEKHFEDVKKEMFK